MVTAIDTNVLSALLTGNAADATHARQRLQEAAREGELLVSAPVFAELTAIPKADEVFIETFLRGIRVSVDWQLNEVMWRHAALAFRAYAQRRRQHKGDKGARRNLADFIIGAHAVGHGARLLSFDEGHYRTAFPELILLG